MNPLSAVELSFPFQRGGSGSIYDDDCKGKGGNEPISDSGSFVTKVVDV